MTALEEIIGEQNLAKVRCPLPSSMRVRTLRLVDACPCPALPCCTPSLQHLCPCPHNCRYAISGRTQSLLPIASLHLPFSLPPSAFLPPSPSTSLQPPSSLACPTLPAHRWSAFEKGGRLSRAAAKVAWRSCCSLCVGCAGGGLFQCMAGCCALSPRASLRPRPAWGGCLISSCVLMHLCGWGVRTWVGHRADVCASADHVCCSPMEGGLVCHQGPYLQTRYLCIRARVRAPF